MVVALPGTVPSCDWASITVNFLGCTKSTYQGFAGVPIPLYATPPPSPTTTPGTYSVSAITVVSGLNVVFNTAGAKVSIHEPYLTTGTAPNSFENSAETGNTYEMDFIVAPFPGQYGLRQWSFEISTGQKVCVVCNLVDPAREMSE